MSIQSRKIINTSAFTGSNMKEENEEDVMKNE